MKKFVLVLPAIVVLSAAVQAGCNCQSRGPVMYGSGYASGIASGGPVAPGYLMPAPPPGTLGKTYTRVSHLIPKEEHPRSAMLAVRDRRAIKFMRVQRMGGFRMKNGIWLFEAERPLFPGQDHVVRVEAWHEKADIQPYNVKCVRLIPGRLVYLDF